MKATKIHFINEDSGKIIAQPTVFNVPSVGDEIRLGGEGNERFYKVIRRVWAYDEEGSAGFDRVNIGVADAGGLLP